MDLPQNLQEMISVLTRTNGLNGWTIFTEKSGSVTVKIRFAPVSHDKPPSPPDQVSYVKKPAARERRDMKRAMDHKSHIQTRSMAKVSGQQDKETECARVSDSNISDLGLDISPESAASQVLEPTTPTHSPLVPATPDTPELDQSCIAAHPPKQELFAGHVLHTIQ